MGTRRGIHSKPNKGHTDEWITPPELLRDLGPFDLDPCAHPEQFYRTAKRMVSPPFDGLAFEWTGMVWLNPPFSQMRPWLSKLAQSKHAQGIALAAARTEVVKWFWPCIWESADAILFLRGRLHFRRPDGSRRRPDGKKWGNAGHGSVLAAYGPAAAERLKKNRAMGRYFDL